MTVKLMLSVRGVAERGGVDQMASAMSCWVKVAPATSRAPLRLKRPSAGLGTAVRGME